MDIQSESQLDLSQAKTVSFKQKLLQQAYQRHDTDYTSDLSQQCSIQVSTINTEESDADIFSNILYGEKQERAKSVQRKKKQVKKTQQKTGQNAELIELMEIVRTNAYLLEHLKGAFQAYKANQNSNRGFVKILDMYIQIAEKETRKISNNKIFINALNSKSQQEISALLIWLKNWHKQYDQVQQFQDQVSSIDLHQLAQIFKQDEVLSDIIYLIFSFINIVCDIENDIEVSSSNEGRILQIARLYLAQPNYLQYSLSNFPAQLIGGNIPIRRIEKSKTCMKYINQQRLYLVDNSNLIKSIYSLVQFTIGCIKRNRSNRGSPIKQSRQPRLSQRSDTNYTINDTTVSPQAEVGQRVLTESEIINISICDIGKSPTKNPVKLKKPIVSQTLTIIDQRLIPTTQVLRKPLVPIVQYFQRNAGTARGYLLQRLRERSPMKSLSSSRTRQRTPGSITSLDRLNSSKRKRINKSYDDTKSKVKEIKPLIETLQENLSSQTFKLKQLEKEENRLKWEEIRQQKIQTKNQIIQQQETEKSFQQKEREFQKKQIQQERTQRLKTRREKDKEFREYKRQKALQLKRERSIVQEEMKRKRQMSDLVKISRPLKEKNLNLEPSEDAAQIQQEDEKLQKLKLQMDQLQRQNNEVKKAKKSVKKVIKKYKK